MIKIISLTFQLLLILFIALLVVNNTFVVSFEINDLIYSFPSPYFLGFLLFLFVFIFVIQSIFFRIKYKINKYKTKKLLDKQKKGYDYFTRGMVAIANKDYKKAATISLKLNKFLTNDKSLFMLLRSEVLKKTKDFDQLKITYNEMVNNTFTKELGEIGLMEYYLSVQDYHHAYLYAESLFLKNPQIDKLYPNIIQIVSKTKNWSQLLNISKKAYEFNIISKETYNEHKSIALYEIANIKFQSDIEESLKLMKEAISLRGFFTPYVKFIVSLFIQNNNITDVKKLLNRAWNNNPSSELRNFVVDISLQLKLDVVKFISSFKNIKNPIYQNQMLKTQAYISNQKWLEAREQIKNVMTEKPSKEICDLMAMIEIGENNDIAKSKSWKMRGDSANVKNCWICTITNQPHKEWSSVSKDGYFNSLEWKQIPMLYNQIERKNNEY
tara:strand:+ start:15099 stop:16418 length:1320 start_codon:yes stop_codon:yes gene_type:complete